MDKKEARKLAAQALNFVIVNSEQKFFTLWIPRVVAVSELLSQDICRVPSWRSTTAEGWPDTFQEFASTQH